MQTKRFTGSSVRAVMADVRETFGRDALILEQQRTGAVVEMLATVATAGDTTDISRSNAAAPSKAVPRLHKPQLASDLPTASVYLERLRAIGFSETVLARLRPGPNSWRAVMKALLQLLPSPRPLPTNGLVCVRGPSGAGVTSSLIKIAVHLLRSGKDPKRLRFAQCGPQRLGADEPLILAAQMLDVPVQRQTPEAALASLADAHPETLLLADLSAAHPDAIPTLPLDDPLWPQQDLVVLPAHWQAEALQPWLEGIDSGQPSSQRQQCIVTHIDNRCYWGDWLSVIIERNMPLAMLGSGPRLPDDIRVPQTPWLERQLLDQIDRSRPATKVKAGEPAVGH